MPPHMELTPTRIPSKPPQLPEIDLRSDSGFSQSEPKPGIWNFRAVEKAAFVPRAAATAFKPSLVEQESEQQPTSAPPMTRKVSFHNSPMEMDEEDDLVPDIRPRAETIAVDRVKLEVPQESRIERSKSSPPKVKFSVLHKPDSRVSFPLYFAGFC